MKIFDRVGLFLLFLSASRIPAGAVQHNKRRKLSRLASKGTQKTGDATEDADFEEEVRRDEVSFFSSPKKKKNQDTRCRTSPRLSKLANSSPPVDEQKKRDVDEQEPMCHRFITTQQHDSGQQHDATAATAAFVDQSTSLPRRIGIRADVHYVFLKE